MRIALSTVASFATIIIAAVAWQRTEAQSTSALRQVAAITLPGVKGRIDHLAFDAKRRRLFVAALGNDTVESWIPPREHTSSR